MASLRYRAIGWGVAVVTLLGMAAVCIGIRDHGRRMTCGHNLFEIGLALRSYHMQFGAFPPGVLCNEAEQPANSWRTVIVPGRLWYTFPSDYEFAEPWYSATNSSLLASEHFKAVGHFQCPAARNDNQEITNYVAVIGPGTMWAGCNPVKQSADDSDADKILVIEVINSDIRWMETRDLTLDEALDAVRPKGAVRIGSRHWGGVHYVTVGGKVRTLDPNIDRESLRKLFVRDAIDSSSKATPALAPE